MAGFFLSQMMGGNRAGLAQQTPQASPAFRDNRQGWLRPNGAPGAGRAGMAPVSATAEGMEPSRTPDLICCLLRLGTISSWSSSCSSTWQVGGALVVNIE